LFLSTDSYKSTGTYLSIGLALVISLTISTSSFASYIRLLLNLVQLIGNFFFIKK